MSFTLPLRKKVRSLVSAVILEWTLKNVLPKSIYIYNLPSRVSFASPHPMSKCTSSVCALHSSEFFFNLTKGQNLSWAVFQQNLSILPKPL